MGLPALWDTIRSHEEVIPIAQLAEDHHRRHGRPLRIAVDEAYWRFNNLTPQQVYMIREISNQQAFQGIEKAMFYRLCRLLTLNIQLIFVFDGPRRPWKRSKRGQGRINYEERRLLQELLRYLGVPYHEAPGEAEAECARMQILGIVDAVWSQDSDSLMFGCTLWLHDHRVAKDDKVKDRSKENTKKHGKYASLVRAADLKEKYRLDREGLVLFAMLVGGDYDQNGLPQCGRGIALQAVKQGLGTSLCECRNERDCRFWSQELNLFLQSTPRGRSITVPPTFPDYQTLTKYYRPIVTSDHELLGNSRLNLDYIRPIQEHELLRLTRERFNIWGRLYMNWIGPILLIRDFVSREPSRPKEMVHDIKISKQRSKKTEEQLPERTFERKITFSPFGVSSLCGADFEGLKSGNWNGDSKVLFDPNYRVECEMPEYWLRKVLPEDVFNPSLPTPKTSSKRKRAADDTEQAMDASNDKGIRTPHKVDAPDADMPSQSLSKRQRLSVPTTSPSLGKAQELRDVIEISDSESEQNHPSLSSSSKMPSHNAMIGSRQGFGLSASSSQAFSSITRDRYEDRTEFDISENEDEDEDFLLALKLSMQEMPENPAPSSSRGKFDDIFAMREAGRSVLGASVPAWSLDEMSHELASSVSHTPSRRPRENSSTRNNSSSRGTHANLAGAGLVETPTRYPSQQINMVRSPALLPAERQTSHVGSKASPLPGDRFADIRAARIRHFAATSTPTSRDASSKVSSAATDTSVDQTSSRKAPEGIECIDLTDD